MMFDRIKNRTKKSSVRLCMFLCLVAVFGAMFVFANANVQADEASAWVNPGGYTFNYPGPNDQTGSLKTLSTPTSLITSNFGAAGDWSAYESGSGAVDSDRNYKSANDKKSATLYVMIWADIQLSAEMKTAIANGRITSVNVSLSSKSGSEYWTKGSNSYLSHYIAGGSSGGVAVTSFSTVSSSKQDFSHNAYSSYDTDTSSLSLTNDQLKNCSYIRFGVHAQFNKQSTSISNHQIILDRPTVTAFSVSYSGITASFAAGTGGTIASGTSVTLPFGAANYAKATANSGYYFTSWSNGATTSTINLAGYNYASDTTFTANFALVPYSGSTSFTFTNAAQGPEGSTISGCTITNAYTGTINSGSSYNSTSKPSQAGSYTLTITVKRGSETVGSRAINFTVNKANVTLSSLSATSITYGQTLAFSSVTGTATNSSQSGQTAAGSYIFTASTTKPAVSDSNTTAYGVTFTPDTASAYNYNSGTSTCKLIVNKCTPNLSNLLATAIIYGQNLGDSSITGTATNGYDGNIASGSYVFTSYSTKPTVADSNKTAYAVTFTSTNENYNNTTSTCVVPVNKCTPVLSELASTAIVYGQSLLDSAVSGAANNNFDSAAVGGTYKFTVTTTTPSVADSGTAYGVTFIPSDSANYNNGSSSCSIVVLQRTVTLSWTNTSLIYNKSIVLPTAIAGNLVFSDSCSVSVSGTGVNVGTYTATAISVSNSNYMLPQDRTRSYQITPFTVALSWTNTSPVYNGCDQIPAATATNLFAGDACTITVSGARSQAGTGYTATAAAVSNSNYKLPASVTTGWAITPKGLDISFWRDSISLSYTFTGGNINPLPVVSDNLLGLLVKDTDYTVTYAQNYAVATGGTVYVSGKNNYQSQTEVSFAISKAQHNVFFASLRYLNDGVGLEQLVPQHSDFEVAFLPAIGYANNYIMLYAYTDAVYPKTFSATGELETKQLIISADSDVRLEYISNTIVNRGGAYYSLTTAKMYLSNTDNIVKYGITKISIEGALDNENYNPNAIAPLAARLDNDGYAEDFGKQDDTPLWHTVFIKKNHTVGGSFLADISKVYGDDAFDLMAGLNSGLNDFVITSSNTNVLTVADTQEAARAATIKNAGATTLTLYHQGVSDLDYPANSYTAAYAQITVEVSKATLTITPANKTTVYGTRVFYDNVGTSYVFGGFCYNDNYSLITGIVNSYDEAAMRDTGTYYIVVEDAVINSQYQNYYLEYPEGVGKLTITPKTVYALIEDAEKEYGKDIPAMPISYTGFAYGETETLAAAFVAPTLSYNGAHKLSDVGQYTIGLAGGSAQNYTINIADTAKLIINKTGVDIYLEAKTVDYSAKSVLPNLPDIAGVAGGTLPLGNISYLYDNDYIDTPPVDAGIYKVRVVFEAAEGNYKNTVKDFEVAITINTIAPAFVLEGISVDYNAKEYQSVPSLAEVQSSVLRGSTPNGYLVFEYSADGVSFAAAYPKDTGSYTVRATYLLEDGVKDNYTAGSVYDFEGVLVINKIEVSLDLDKAAAVYGSNNGISPDRLEANEGIPHGVYTEYTWDSAKYPYELHYRYFVDGSWTDQAPYNAGKYDVEITFNPLFDRNYKTTTVEFAGAVEIACATPALFLDGKEASYSGKRIAQNSAFVQGITGGSQPIGTLEYLFAPHNSIAAIFRKDYPVINVNLQNGQNDGYDIIVRFVAAQGSNYESCEQRFDKALMVMPVSPKISLAPSYGNFSGASFDTSKISAIISGVQGGSMPLGRLSYEFMSGDSWTAIAPINSGVYSVRVTFTPAATSETGTHGNYTPASGVFADSVEIKKVSPIISIVPVKSDYTGAGVVIGTQDGSIKVAGVNAAYAPIGGITVQYGMSNDEWSNIAPTESGVYKIRVSYTADPNENYIDVVKIFNSAVTIYNIPPTFAALIPEVYVFDGERAPVTFAPAIVGNDGKGSISLSYLVGNSWTSRAPSDAGVYKVRINYNAASKDNYKSSSQVFDDALTILPKELIIAPIEGQSKVYDNRPIAAIRYTVDGIANNDTLVGELVADIGTDVGDYQILLGSIGINTYGRPENYANNYQITFVSGIYYSILPAEVVLTFNEVSEALLIYRPGDHKAKYVSVSATRGDVHLRVDITIIGDDVEVGEFAVSAKLADPNYKLPAISQKVYTITAAQMDAADNLFRNKAYAYSGSKYLFEADRVLDGATITYIWDGKSSEAPFEFDKVGVYTVNAVISKPNYLSVEISATMTIAKSLPIVNALAYTGKLTYGDALPDIACDNENGTITLDDGQELIPGYYDYKWTFVPNDTESYLSVTGRIKLYVEKAETTVTVQGSLVQNVSNPSKLSAMVTSRNDVLKGNLTIIYKDSKGNEYNQLPSAAGKYTMIVSYSGDENYAPSSYSTIIKVDETPNFSWAYTLGIVLAGLGVAAGIVSAAKKRA